MKVLYEGKSLSPNDDVLAPLMKHLGDSMMEGELRDNHLTEYRASGASNWQKGKVKKKVKGLNNGNLELETGLDRVATFELKVIPKRQLIITEQLEGYVWSMYAKVMNTRAVSNFIREMPIQLTEQPIYGADRLGTLFRQANNYQCTISDHVGNTRVVINRNKLAIGAADIVYYADYYPFGSEVRSGGTGSRYGYQGLYGEKDKETGWNNFELRNFDSAIGRWLTTDPYAQYHSGYVGMGNNPVSGFDVNGGWSE